MEYKVIKNKDHILGSFKAIIEAEKRLFKCPICKTDLYEVYPSFPLLPTRGSNNVRGYYCKKCNVIFVDRKNNIIKEKLPAISNYNTRQLVNRFTNYKIENDKKILMQISSAEVLIAVRFYDNSTCNYIIVTNETETDDKRIVHYLSDVGRELLSAAFAPEREEMGAINGKEYMVIATINPKNTNEALSEKLVSSSINIQPKGGFYNPKDKNEIVDTLVYSLYTNRYEVMRATYDNSLGICYIDISRFREYVKKYGKPSNAPKFLMRDPFKNWSFYETSAFDNLNEESILKQYGYSVGKISGMNARFRQELLSEMVDLEIITVKKVVTLLEFFINSHSSPQYFEARSQWKEDLEFIKNYKVNPKRFIIASF